jgi:glycyl-tRNA synthetase
MFSRLFRTYGKLPLGVAQIGRALRNEIAPRQGLLRMREFSQMELEYFFDPADQGMKGYESVNGYKLNILTEDEQEKQGKGKGQAIQLTCDECIERNLVPNQIMAYFMVSINEFLKLCGIPEEQIRHRQIPTTERAHYSAGTFDIEAKTSYGWTELVGIAYRTDYDLRSHMEMSKKDLTVVTPDGRRFIPHVVEPSFGMDRIFWAALEHAYKKGEDRGWEWLDLPLVLSPYDVAIFPLMKKDGLAEKAQEVTGMLRSSSVSALYDESGSIGKRYARADEVGIKWAVTIDYDTLKDNTVTLRDRNTTKQERINIADIASKISSK